MSDIIVVANANLARRNKDNIFTGDNTFGNDTDYVKIDVNGELTLVGGATVFKDQFVDGLAVKGGATDPPVFAAFQNGVWSNRFDDGATMSAHGTLEFQHDYKEGSNVEVHIHWSPSTTNTGNCRWGFEYTLAGMNGTYGATTTVYATQAGSGVVNKHQYLTLASLSGSGITIGTVIAFRIFRDGANGADTFTGNAFLHRIAFHYESDRLGTAQ